VYVPVELADDRLDAVAAYLGEVSRPRVRLSRARSWAIWILGRPICIHVERTEEVLADCEETMLGLGLLPEEAPCRIVLCAGCNAPEDRELLRRLGRGLAERLGGVATEPVK
jgi:hypothetical protein